MATNIKLQKLMKYYKPNEERIAVVLKLLNILPLTVRSNIHFNFRQFLKHTFSEQLSRAEHSYREVISAFMAFRWLTSIHVACILSL